MRSLTTPEIWNHVSLTTLQGNLKHRGKGYMIPNLWVWVKLHLHTGMFPRSLTRWRKNIIYLNSFNKKWKFSSEQSDGFIWKNCQIYLEGVPWLKAWSRSYPQNIFFQRQRETDWKERMGRTRIKREKRSTSVTVGDSTQHDVTPRDPSHWQWCDHTGNESGHGWTRTSWL